MNEFLKKLIESFSQDFGEYKLRSFELDRDIGKVGEVPFDKVKVELTLIKTSGEIDEC